MVFEWGPEEDFDFLSYWKEEEDNLKLASSAESVGMLRLRQVAKCMIQSDFHHLIGAKIRTPFW